MKKNVITRTNSNPAENEIHKRKVKTNLGSVFELKKVLTIQSTSTDDEGNYAFQQSPDNQESKSTSARSNHCANRSGFSVDSELLKPGNTNKQDQTSSTSVG